MKFELSLKKFEATQRFNKLLVRYLHKLKRKLHNFSEDSTELTVIIKGHEKNHFFNGRFSLQLPVKPLNVFISGNTAEEVLAEGFETLLKNYDIYKGKHFKGSSKYPNHSSIREGENY